MSFLDANLLNLLFDFLAQTTSQMVVKRTLVFVEFAANDGFDAWLGVLLHLGFQTP